MLSFAKIGKFFIVKKGRVTMSSFRKIKMRFDV